MKRLLTFLLLFSAAAFGQMSSTGSITTNASNCFTTNACILLNLFNSPALSTSTASIVVSGSWTGTLTFEASVDGINFTAIAATPLAGGASVTTTTANGSWTESISGLNQIRMRGSAAMTGAAVVFIQASAGGGSGGSSTPSTLSGSSPGVFTNTQMNDPFTFVVNSCSPSTEYNTLQVGQFSTEALAGCVTVPNTSTVHQADGVAGFVSAATASTNAVGGYFQARCLVNNCNIWGANPLASDSASFASNSMYGAEIDVNVANAASKGWGVRTIGAWTAQPTKSKTGPGNMPGHSIGAPISGSNQWTAGFSCDTAATDNGTGNGNCIDIMPIANIASKPSQAITFHATTSTNTIFSSYWIMTADANNNPSFVLVPNSQSNTNGTFMAVLPVHGLSSGIAPANMLSAGHATLSGGTITVAFTQAYTTAPECVAIGQTTANAMKALASTTQIVITSSSGADTQVVSWFCSPAAN